MAYGSKIVKSSFDFKTSTIGPYTLPVKFHIIDPTLQSTLPVYRLYEEMLFHKDSIATFNMNNYCICVVTPTQILQVPAYRNKPVRDLLEWRLQVPITNRHFQHIGYVKTYSDCLAVSELPEHLILDINRTVPEGFNEELQFRPRLNPPITLYKELVYSDADAVCIDDVSGDIKFLYK